MQHGHGKGVCFYAFLMRYVGGGLTDAYGISKFAMYHWDVTNPIIYLNQKVLFINAITNFIDYNLKF